MFFLRLAGCVGSEEQFLGLAGEDVALVVDLPIHALVLDVAAVDKDVGALTQLAAHEVALALFGVELVDGLEQESFLVVGEADFLVVHVLADVVFQLVDKLLLGEVVDFLGYEDFIVAKGGDDSAGEAEAFEASTAKHTF